MFAPKLRFKEFDGDWNKNTIGDFVLNYKGGASLTPVDFVDYSECEVIPKKAISSGGTLRLDKNVPTFCTSEFFNSNQNYVVNSDYLITTLRDLVPSGPSIGYIVKYQGDKEYILAQGVYGFKIKTELCRDFLIQFSNTSKFRLHMQSIMVGSTQVHIRNQDYFSTELFNPSWNEQTKIASFLSAVDEKISQLNQKHSLLSQYKQGMMQKLFSQQIRFKADDGREFGEWESKQISKVFTNKSKSFNPLLNESLPCIELEHLSQNTGQILGTVNSTDQQSTKNLFEPNSVLYGKLRPYLRKFAKPQFKGVCSSEIWVLTGLKISNDYLFQLIQSEQFTELTNIQSGSKMPRADWNVIADAEIEYPCLEEQTKIANFLSTINQKIEGVAQQIEQAKTWKKGLLQQMFV